MIVFLCCLLSGVCQLREQIHHGKMALRKSQYLTGPVIHLYIDIVGIIAGPGRIGRIIPYPLQIQGLAARPGACNGQIPGILQHQRRQGRIIHPFSTEMKPLCCGKVSGQLRSQVQIHPVIKRLVIRHMIFSGSFIIPPRLLQAVKPFPQLFQHLSCIPVPGNPEACIAGPGADSEQRITRPVHVYPRPVGSHRAVSGNHPCTAREPEGIRVFRILIDKAGSHRRIARLRMIRSYSGQKSLSILRPVYIVKGRVHTKGEIQHFIAASSLFRLCRTVDISRSVRIADKIFPPVSNPVPDPGNRLRRITQAQAAPVILNISRLRLYHHLQGHIPAVIGLPHGYMKAG